MCVLVGEQNHRFITLREKKTRGDIVVHKDHIYLQSFVSDYAMAFGGVKPKLRNTEPKKK